MKPIALTLVFVSVAGPVLAQQARQDTSSPQPDSGASGNAENVTVTASRVNMMGKAITASQETVTEKELDLRPVYRVEQLLEADPGLVVTMHSGEGKASQYLIRGYNRMLRRSAISAP